MGVRFSAYHIILQQWKSRHRLVSPPIDVTSTTECKWCGGNDSDDILQWLQRYQMPRDIMSKSSFLGVVWVLRHSEWLHCSISYHAISSSIVALLIGDCIMLLGTTSEGISLDFTAEITDPSRGQNRQEAVAVVVAAVSLCGDASTEWRVVLPNTPIDESSCTHQGGPACTHCDLRL